MFSPAPALSRRHALAAGLLAVTFARAARGATIVARLVSPPDGLMGLSDYPYWVARARA
jgi:hypothetical protein